MLKFLCITTLILVCLASALARVPFQAWAPGRAQLTEIVSEFGRKTREIQRLFRWSAWNWLGQLIQHSARSVQALYRPWVLQPVAVPRQGRRKPPARPIGALAGWREHRG